MVSKSYKSAEYEALKRVILADKRLRRFQYALTLLLFLLVVAGGWNIQQNIARKIDGLVNGSVSRGDARQKETKTISRETTRYITCLFILPIDQRTPANQEKCFKAADLPGGLDRSDFSPIILNPDGSVVLASAIPVQQVADNPSAQEQPASSNTSSTQSAPTTSTSTANNVQPTSQPSRSTIQRVEDATAKVIDTLWPFN